ncbi:hypothetical protein [Rhodopirellula bahusiensis]|uniref:hypothetical protein n=1 Tax=Rhodopirellula bahusiensis TaxID=2014065 RepID=UPI00326636C3
MSNPYESPKSEVTAPDSMGGLLSHRRCPSCHASVPWSRYWLRAWMWAKWPCRSCEAILTFSRPRRFIAAAVFIALMTGARFAIHFAGFGPDAFGGFFIQQVLLCLLPAMVAFLIDGVVVHVP